jgi:uncharacterized protein YjbI with pentapeptide repeats
MADPQQVELIRGGAAEWNKWRADNDSVRPDLSEANLRDANLHKANLGGANLRETDLRGATLSEAFLDGADLGGANLRGAYLYRAYLCANLHGANLREANLSEADLRGANLSGADLSEANLLGAVLYAANLHGAVLREADLSMADLSEADLSGADLSGANICVAALIATNLQGAILSGAKVYGISVWDVKLRDAVQTSLVITPDEQPEITVDNLEVAQFIYLLLHNSKIRDVIDTIGKKGVLLLGRFTGGRIAILERLRNELRNRDFLPIVFNFDRPDSRDFTETIRVLAGLSHFVIADITNPRSAPLELQATVPEYMIPFVPIIEEGEEPFAMLNDLWLKYRDWMFEPIYYSSLDRLIDALDTEIIKPAEVRFAELLARKAEKMKGKHI